MNLKKRFLPALTAAAVMLTLASCDKASESQSTASQAAESAASSVASVDVLADLTDDELQSLISGSATLDEIAQQRASSTASASGAASASGVASSAAAGSAATAASGATASGAASSQTTAPQASSAASSEPAYEAEIRDLISQLYAVKAKAESGLNSIIAAAKAEYKALPAEKQTKAKKIAICVGKAGELKALESECDQEVDDIVSQMRAILTANGQSTALADEALASYKSQKSAMVDSLTAKLYG